jgi:hypothetical protein
LVPYSTCSPLAPHAQSKQRLAIVRRYAPSTKPKEAAYLNIVYNQMQCSGANASKEIPPKIPCLEIPRCTKVGLKSYKTALLVRKNYPAAVVIFYSGHPTEALAIRVILQANPPCICGDFQGTDPQTIIMVISKTKSAVS